MSLVNQIAASFIIGATKLVTGARGRWQGCAPSLEQRIYFANHTSHGDFLLVWTAFPRELRARARPVAGSDYWRKGPLRRYLGERVFDAVLVDRVPPPKSEKRWDPLEPVRDALESGASLIIFPEGTRNTTDASLQPFKSGIYYLAAAYPDIPLVPTWIENVGRVMPKGEVFPVPLLCSVTFGEPVRLETNEHKGKFMTRLEGALQGLREGDPRPEAGT
jgi:1-acyl-sn-glycerol-3-phosphate acyltransferase